MGVFMWWVVYCGSVYVVGGVVWACLCGEWCSVGVFMWWVVYYGQVYVVDGSVGVFMWWVV